MSDLKVALEELKDESDSGKLVTIMPSGSRWSSARQKGRLILAGLVALSCALLAVSAFRFTSTRTDRNIASRPTPVTSYQGEERQADFSPSGTEVAFTWNGEKQDNWDIYLKVVGSSAAPLRLTTDPASDTKPKWSPDGKFIAFIRSTTDTDAVILTSALGGAERRLADFPTAVDTGLSWSPDSKWLAVAEGARQGSTALHLISLETGESRVLTTPPTWSGGDFDPAFSPDGRSLAFVRERGMNIEELWVLPLSKSYNPQGEPKQVLGDGKRNRGPAWTANGRQLVFSSGELASAGMYRMSADGSSAPIRIDSLGDGVSEPSVSESSRRLAFTHTFRSASIWRIANAASAAPEQFIASSSFRDVFPQYSPDGKRIVFYSNRTGVNQIWVCKSDGTQPVQLTTMTGTTTGTPRWSPDGQWISFDSNSGGHWQIYVVNASGGKPRAVTTGEMTNVVASWSRDGKWIYFTSKRSGTEQVWKIRSGLFGSQGLDATPVQVTHNGGTSSMESPDGQTLYFTKTTPAFAFSLWKMSVDGGPETEVLPSLHRYSFAVTAQAVFFTTPSGLKIPAEVKKLDLATAKITSLYTLPKRVDLGLELSPDQKYLLFAQLDYIGSDLMSVENFR
jgi:eukaryotic-like serine/threonine-protein kinase